MCSTWTSTKADMKTHIENVHNLFEIVQDDETDPKKEAQSNSSSSGGSGGNNNCSSSSGSNSKKPPARKRLAMIQTDDHVKKSLSKLEKLAGVNSTTSTKTHPFWQCLACRRPFSTKLELQEHVQCTHVEPVKDEFDDDLEAENLADDDDDVAAIAKNGGGNDDENSGLLKLSIRGYCCDDCGRCFDEIDYLFVHYQVVHPTSNPPLVKDLRCSTHSAMLCFICLLYFRTGKWFSGHHCVNEVDVGMLERMKRAADIPPCFLCDVCASTFKWKSVYQYHRETKHKHVTPIDWDAVEAAPVPFTCDKCYKGFTLAKGLREHMCARSNAYGSSAAAAAAAAQISKPITCPTCGARLSSRCTLRRHIRCVHENVKRPTKPRHERVGKCYRPSEPTIKCPFCDLKFKSSRDTLQHAHDVHSQLLRTPYYCVPCGRAFEMNQKLIKHNETYHFAPEDAAEVKRVCDEAETMTEDGPYYVCKLCARKFADRRPYFLHHRWHQVERNFTCEHCGKPMTTRAALRTHIQHVHKKEMRRYECDLCHKVLSSKFSLREHLAAHSGVRAFTCEKCGKTFVSRTRLQYHARRHIFGPGGGATAKRHKCHICDKEFKKKQTLTDHLAVHSGVKNFQCPECGKMFFTKLHVYFHKLHVHCTERPFKCTQCDAAFPLKSYLRRHAKLHDTAAVAAAAATTTTAAVKNTQKEGSTSWSKRGKSSPTKITKVIFNLDDGDDSESAKEEEVIIG